MKNQCELLLFASVFLKIKRLYLLLFMGSKPKLLDKLYWLHHFGFERTEINQALLSAFHKLKTPT
ncbi:hypothetical protein EXN66_Car004796 [Channa argus]|uniref:Uncharacterized protein n=1 Tax=Channa argus TaxID=215402 RepID=A0A6G1PG60_CHAAH|nr:hypothetical protein EXN66_Car004796 [Channa argus]